MCKKCICFARVSTNQQDLEAQKNEVYQAALFDGYKKEEISIVEGKESAIKKKEEERQTLNEMKEIIENNPSIESVYIYAIDRLARRVSIVLSMKDYLLGKEINLVFLHPYKMKTIKNRTPKGIEEDTLTLMLLMLLSYGAQMEMEVKKARFKTERDKLRKAGQISEGSPMFGYKNENKFVVIDESVSPYIKQAFEDYISKDISLDSIYQKFVSLNLLKLGKNSRTGARRISDLFHNLKYSGRTEKGKTIYPAIVSPELQDKVIAKINTKTSKPKTKSSNIYYCKGIIKNSKTNYTLIGKSAYCAYVDSYIHKTVNLNVVDGIVWKVCCDWLPIFENITTDEEKENIDIRISELQQQIENNIEHLKWIDGKESFILNVLEDGNMQMKEYVKKYKNYEINRKKIEDNNNSLKHQIETLEIQKNEISENDKIQNFVKYLNYTNIKDDAERFDLIHKVIKRVEVDFINDESRKITIYPVDKIMNVEKQVYYYTYEKKTKKQTLTDEFGKGGRKLNRYILDRYHQKDKHKKK